MARFAFAVMTIGALIGPIPADGQLVGGVFGARARDSFGGTNGIGVEAGVSLPLVPLEVFAAGTLFRPACSGCDLQGWSLGGKFSVLPLPVLHPYVTFGRTWRDLEDLSNGLMLDGQGFLRRRGSRGRHARLRDLCRGPIRVLDRRPCPDPGSQAVDSTGWPDDALGWAPALGSSRNRSSELRIRRLGQPAANAWRILGP